ncbi:MAG: hypothetical protein P4M11_09035 [Candidatus Pacebacteria bacterium]|nr:hypothetical protein [Candidatus Paceibacterota bacterium]
MQKDRTKRKRLTLAIQKLLRSSEQAAPPRSPVPILRHETTSNACDMTPPARCCGREGKQRWGMGLFENVRIRGARNSGRSMILLGQTDSGHVRRQVYSKYVKGDTKGEEPDRDPEADAAGETVGELGVVRNILSSEFF